MPAQPLDIKKFSQAINRGIDRLRHFRASRLMFLKEYAGQYYDRDQSTIGDEPLNMIFNGISIIVPNLVSNFPKAVVTSRFLTYRGYAELLALGLDYLAKEIDLRMTIRRWVIDALFTIGIIKTGLATSDNTVTLGPNDTITVGAPFAEIVDFDDFVLDPACRRLEEATFMGNRVRVPRQMLLDSDLFRNDLVEKLPPAGQDNSQKRRESERLSQGDLLPSHVAELQDYVEMYELEVPEAKAKVWLPATLSVPDDYLRIDDMYGPDEGEYTFLSLTQPLPNNPMPVAPVGIWYDLHKAGNKMAVKIIEQADRQKSVLTYKRSAADDAQEIIDASDGESVGLDDPDAAKVQNFGGQVQSNEVHLQQLSYWFSLMSGGTDQLGGQTVNADTATGQNILQANANVRVEDMRDLVYIGTSKVQRKLAWYLHSDPLIALPLIKRQPIPAQTMMTPYGPIITPPRMMEQQVILTPEVRAGEFLDFHFSVEARSMSRLDPSSKLQKALLFASKVLPAAAAAAQTCQAMGVPFSFARFVVQMGKELDIEWMDEIFYDPEFQMQTAQLLARSPQMAGSKGALPQQGGGLPGVMQNGGAPNTSNIPSPQMEANQNAQSTAAESQSMSVGAMTNG